MLSEAVARYRSASPDARIAVLCREPFAGVVAHYAVVPDRVAGVPFDPYGDTEPSTSTLANARTFFAGLELAGSDVLAAPEIAPTWLTRLAIETLEPKHVRTLGGDERLGDARSAVSVVSPVVADDASVRPRLVVPAFEGSGRRAKAIAVFPFAESRVPFKVWPRASFVELLKRMRKWSGATLLLVGGTAEARELDELRSLLGAGVETVAGEPGEYGRVFTAIANARGFVGNDTGLSHAASALGLPGVTIYGGGHWPAYGPWANGSVGVVAPLPCFGCAWDCVFDRGFCVETIGVEDVASALRSALAAPGAPARVVRLSTVSPLERDVIERASVHLRATQSQANMYRAAADERLDALVANAEVGEALDEIELVAAERLADVKRLVKDMEAAHARATFLEAAAVERLAVVDRLQREVGELRVALETSWAEREHWRDAASLFEKVAAERLEALETTHAGLEAALERVHFLDGVAEERLQAMFEIERSAASARRAFAYEAARSAHRIDEMETEVREQRRLAETYEAIAAERLVVLKRTNDEARAAAEQYAAAIGISNGRMAALERVAAERLAVMERTADEARRASERFREELATRDAEREKSEALPVASGLEALQARVTAAEEAASERLDALHASSEEMRRVNKEAERRSVIIAELTALVTSQHDQIDLYAKRTGKR